jgi:hypothetical protein
MAGLAVALQPQTRHEALCGGDVPGKLVGPLDAAEAIAHPYIGRRHD